MDLASILALFIGSSMLVMGIALDFEKGTFQIEKLMMFVDYPSIVLVIFGSLGGSMLLAQNFKNWVVSVKAGKQVFSLPKENPRELIEKIYTFAETARRDGILALENVMGDIQDNKFLVTGLQLAVDGTDPDMIASVLETELEILEDRHNQNINFWALVGKYMPTWGMIGTLVGLVLMLADMRPETIGPNMAIALLTTFYGAVLANFIAIPISDKLKSKHNEEILFKNIVLKGVMSIQQGDPPRIVQQKLNVYLPPSDRIEDK